MRRWWGLATGAMAASMAASGCSSPTVDLGGDPDILWWTDVETGDTSDWTNGGLSVGRIWSYGPSNQLWPSTDVARSGHYSLRASIVTNGFPSSGSSPFLPPEGVLAIREAGLPSAGYYSAWYYLPQAAFPISSGPSSTYWLIFKLRSRLDPTNPSSVVELWDIDLSSLTTGGPGGDLALDLYHHPLVSPSSPPIAPQRVTRIANPPAVPIGRWFQIEVFFQAAPDDSGQITVWQDGVSVFDIEHMPSSPSNYVEWSVGSVSTGLSPPAATLYIDDAAVSLRRLGPSFPPFTEVH